MADKIMKTIKFPENSNVYEIVDDKARQDIATNTAKITQVETTSNQKITNLESATNTKISQVETNKQDKLVSGTNIKNINGESLLGEGNINIKGGGGSGIINPATTSVFAFVTDAQNNKFTLQGNNLIVDWGDGTKETVNGKITHTYEPNLDVTLTVKGKISKLSTYQESYLNKNTYYFFLGDNEITNGGYMFYGITKLKKIARLELPKATTFDYLFYGSHIVENPVMDTFIKGSCQHMFEACDDLSNFNSLRFFFVSNTDSMFAYCPRLLSIPSFDTSRAKSMNDMFSGCDNLSSIPPFDMTNVTTANNMLVCRNLVDINLYNINCSLSIINCPKMQRQALVKLLYNLLPQTPEKPKTLTMGATLLGRLTEEDKLIATNKNWTLK